MINNPLPHNLELEKSVLGCLLIDKSDYVVNLSEDDFYDTMNKTVYKAIRYLNENNKQIDIITVSDLLKKKYNNALELVTNMTNYIVTSENIEYYIKTLKSYTMRKSIIKAAMKAIEKAYKEEYEDSNELKADVLQLMDIQTYDKKDDNNEIQAIMSDVMDDIEKRYKQDHEEKLFTGFIDIDKVTAGFHTEEMTVLAARPGIGKTAFALQLMINIAKKDNSCLFISREMSKLQIGKRILSNMATIDGHKLRLCKALVDEDFKKIGNTFNKVSELPIEINDKLGSIQEIRAYCRELHIKNKLDFLIVDYLQLCKSNKKSDSRRHEIEYISRQLKELSLEFKIPILLLSQLSRNNAQAGREPALYDLRESGAIEQDADNVMFLHLHEDEEQNEDCIEIKVIIEKQRNGPTGYIKLKYYRKTFRFVNSRGW